jgi:hypothetical protein
LTHINDLQVYDASLQKVLAEIARSAIPDGGCEKKVTDVLAAAPTPPPPVVLEGSLAATVSDSPYLE